MACSAAKPLNLDRLEQMLKAAGFQQLVEAIRQVCADEDPETSFFYSAEYAYADLLVKEGKFVTPCGTHTSCAECREL